MKDGMDTTDEKKRRFVFFLCVKRRQNVGDDAHIVPTKYGTVVEKTLNRYRALTNTLLCRITFV